jgi:hypothetical protein
MMLTHKNLSSLPLCFRALTGVGSRAQGRVAAFCYHMKYKFVPSKQWIKKFWGNVDKSAGKKGCWPWTGRTNTHGYGVLWYPGMKMDVGAHRVAFLLSGRKVTEEKPMVIHSCHNRLCCNNAHLDAGSHRDNMADMVQAGRSATGDRNGSRLYPERLARGDESFYNKYPERRMYGDKNPSRMHPERHPKGETHGMAKLTEANVRAIREQYATGGWRQVDLSAYYGVTQAMISLIVRGDSWKHIS